MVDDQEELENGRMFNEMCNVGTRLPPLRGHIQPSNPTSIYEQFKQSKYDYEPKTQQTSSTAKNDKSLVTKEEAQKLRNQVLKSSRPLNPYFERSSSSSPNSQSSPSSNRSTNNYSSTSYLNNEKKENPPARTTPEVRSIPIIRTKMHNIHEPQNSQHTKLPISNFTRPQQRDFMFVETYEDETSDTSLRALEQLEAENRRRIARVEQTTSDEFPSPSTYYFSDDCSSTDRADFQNDNSPKYSSYKANNLPKCAECKMQINDMLIQAIGKSFHPQCFRCVECNKSLDGVPFAVNDDEQVYCMDDYERLYVPICARCQKPIKPSNSYGQIVRVVALDREYHISCYSCENCGLQLTNEEHRRCYPIGDTLLCRKCNLHWQQLGGSMSPLTDL